MKIYTVIKVYKSFQTDSLESLSHSVIISAHFNTVEPPRKGHCMLDLYTSTRDTASGSKIFTIVSIHREPPRRGQPLYKGQNS